jgi:argininosuccinate lyase
MSKLWGGRFSKETNKLVEKFTKSIQYDHKLVLYDILGSLAHVSILRESGYLSHAESVKLSHALNGLYESISNDIVKGKFQYDPDSEDIHTEIQKRLEGDVKDLVLKLQTARSRNDQVVFATKFYSKDQLYQIQNKLLKLAGALNHLCQQNENLIIPGFTHLQHAQPVYLKDYLCAYIEMLIRDKDRLKHVFENIKITMGAGALAGTPIDAKTYSLKADEFFKEAQPDNAYQIHSTANSLDAVSDRDFVIEIIGALSIVAMHLSRLSEDLILWATQEFDFIEIDDAYCTGSSLMPQKKNPDVLELIRGYSGRLYGNLVSVLTMMKGLPLTYNRDMQLDKEPLFNSFEIVSSELEILKGLIETLKFNKAKIEEHLTDESLYATDLVYYLVDKGVPFKEAHTKVGELIRHAIEQNTEIKNLTEGLLKEKLSAGVSKKDIVSLFDPRKSVESKKSVKRKDYSQILKHSLENRHA